MHIHPLTYMTVHKETSLQIPNSKKLFLFSQLSSVHRACVSLANKSLTPYIYLPMAYLVIARMKDEIQFKNNHNNNKSQTFTFLYEELNARIHAGCIVGLVGTFFGTWSLSGCANSVRKGVKV